MISFTQTPNGLRDLLNITFFLPVCLLARVLPALPPILSPNLILWHSQFAFFIRNEFHVHQYVPWNGQPTCSWKWVPLISVGKEGRMERQDLYCSAAKMETKDHGLSLAINLYNHKSIDVCLLVTLTLEQVMFGLTAGFTFWFLYRVVWSCKHRADPCSPTRSQVLRKRLKGEGIT